METEVSKIYEIDIRLSRIYNCKDGRKRIDLITKEWRKTVQYAKLVLEVKLGRKLLDDETVDHINGDKTNDTPENLRVMSLAENAADSAIRLKEQNFTCPQCNNLFSISGRKLKDAANNRKQGKVGPFCGRSCAGKYGTSIQHHNAEQLNVININRTYYSNKELQI